MEGVSHTYPRGLKALDDVSLQLRPGITGLVGANGAGKSTLMRIASGGLRPTAGAVNIGNQSLYERRDRAEALKRIGWMPQAGSFPRSLTALDFVTYLTWLRGVHRGEARTRAEEALTAVELAQVADRRMGALSGGMVRRVWLAQALAAQAEVLLLDEPSTGLDPRQRATMVRLLAEQSQGAVLLSSHILEDVADLADRVIVLDAGRVVYEGPPPEELDARWFLDVTRDEL